MFENVGEAIGASGFSGVGRAWSGFVVLGGGCVPLRGYLLRKYAATPSAYQMCRYVRMDQDRLGGNSGTVVYYECACVSKRRACGLVQGVFLQ